MSDGFDYNTEVRPYVFLQWKGTDACFDFNCKCGAHLHFDGDFAYRVKCPHCNQRYEMPFILYPREIDFDEDEEPYVITMDPDEDMEEDNEGKE